MCLMVAVLATGLLLVTACSDPVEEIQAGDASEPTERTDETAPVVESESGLAETSWLLASTPEVLVDWDVTLFFRADGHVGGFDGCNGYGGRYTAENGALSISEMGGTDAGCQPDVMTSADNFVQSLLASDTYSLDGDVLRLTGQGEDLAFRPTPVFDPDAVINKTWLLETIVNDAPVEAVGGAAFVRFDADGTFTGSTGCRALNGNWSADDFHYAIRFGDFSADGSCSPEMRDQDSDAIGLFEGPLVPVVDNGSLTLSGRGDGQLVYRRAAAGEEPAEPDPTDQIGFDHDPSLAWAVIELTDEEYIIIHSAPGVDDEEVVGELGSGERLIAAGTEVVEVGGNPWRQIHSDADAEGWVEDRYLVSEPGG